jgi:undecaprenyl diphosphate synthase
MKKTIPKHIAIIIDGNRRWAKENGLPIFDGHKKGIALVRHVAEWCFEKGIKEVSFYAFSTENWKRSPAEVKYLMNQIFKDDLFEKDLAFFQEHKIRIVFSGRLEQLPKKLKASIEKAVRSTAKNKRGIVNFCLNYGGRAEIIDAAKKMIGRKIKAKDLSEKTLRRFLYQSGLSDPDLIIRTGGEQRLSNFLLWEAAYSELYFLKKRWPDFSRKDLERALKEYSLRQRRGGK